MRGFYAALAVFLLGVDQYTKYLARFWGEDIIEWTSWARWRLVYNEGIAFSLPASRWLIVALAVGVSAWLIKTIFEQNKYSCTQKVFFVCVLSGAVGNAIDRALFGKVTDMLSFWNFAIFNFADVWISVGVVGLIAWDIFKVNDIARTE